MVTALPIEPPTFANYRREARLNHASGRSDAVDYAIARRKMIGELRAAQELISRHQDTKHGLQCEHERSNEAECAQERTVSGFVKRPGDASARIGDVSESQPTLLPGMGQCNCSDVVARQTASHSQPIAEIEAVLAPDLGGPLAVAHAVVEHWATVSLLAFTQETLEGVRERIKPDAQMLLDILLRMPSWPRRDIFAAYTAVIAEEACVATEPVTPSIEAPHRDELMTASAQCVFIREALKQVFLLATMEAERIAWCDRAAYDSFMAADALSGELTSLVARW